MRPELKAMAKATFAELRWRNALPEKSTSAMRRYAADYLVHKSAYAPMFEELGVTKGCQLKRSFDCVRSRSWLHMIYYLRCMKWVYDFDSTLIPWFGEVDILSVFALPEAQLREFMKDTKHEFNSLLRRIEEARQNAIGRTDTYKASKIQDSKLIQSYINKEPQELLWFLDLTDEDERPAAALALLVHNLTEEKAAQLWLARHKDEINNWFIRKASWRSYLALFHNNAALADDSFDLTAYYHKDGYVEKITGGISHRSLNLYAMAYQRKLLCALRCIRQVTPLPELKMDVVKEMDEDNFTTAGSITSGDIPEQIRNLASQLAKKHGPVQITSEASGIHVYVADPFLLQTDGEKELVSRHMAINADKYFGLGQWDVDEHPTAENIKLWKAYRSKNKEVPCVMSMKTGKACSVKYLQSLPPIEERLPTEHKIVHKVIAGLTDKHLVPDEYGNLVPEGPGRIVPLSALPKQHPAIQYLYQRGYSPLLMEQYYGAGYCSEALPDDRAVGRYWSRLPCGCVNSPQGRIILPIVDENGVRQGWQARAIDYVDSSGNRYLWTSRETWLQIEKDCVPMHISDEFPQGFKTLRKYINARGLKRNEVLFGLPAAINATKDKPWSERICYVMEGALDAAKGGAQCLALLGKNMSDRQAEIIKKYFSTVVVVADQDTAGRSMVQSVARKLPGYNILEAVLPDGNKDLGDCTYKEAQAVLQSPFK